MSLGAASRAVTVASIVKVDVGSRVIVATDDASSCEGWNTSLGAAILSPVMARTEVKVRSFMVSANIAVCLQIRS